MKYLCINLVREVKDLYTENLKTLMKETEEDINTGIPSSVPDHCNKVSEYQNKVFHMNFLVSQYI